MKGFVNPYNKADKFYFYAYNAPFDADFLRQWFADLGDKYYGSWFWTPPIDMMSIMGYQLQGQREEMYNFSLKSVCIQCGLGWDDEKAHNAIYDIQKTYDLFRRLAPLTMDVRSEQ